MKRKATTQLRRDGNYEEVQSDECVDVEVSTPAEISQRKFFRAKRISRADDEPKGFKLIGTLVSKDLEKALLNKPRAPDFTAVSEEIKEASPDKKDRVQSGFKSAGFASLIAGISLKKEDQLEAQFLTSATPQSKAPSVVNFQSQSSQPPQLYETVENLECSISVNKADRGKGRLEFMLNLAKDKSTALVVFRNLIGNVLYQGLLGKSPTITEAQDVTVDREADSGESEYAMTTYRMTDKFTIDEIRICVPPSKKEGLEKTLNRIRQALTR